MYQPKDIATYLANKKRLLYLAVVAGAVFLIFIGIPIKYAIMDGAEQEARLYQTAIQATDDTQLNYSIDTKQGNVLAEVTVKSVDLVKFPEMNKSFSKVEKREQTYTEHEREVCETTYDSEGNAVGEECHTETYYTWDTTDNWELSGSQVEMADRKYPISLFALSTRGVDASEIIDGQDGHYVYERTKGGIFGRSWLSSDTEGDKRYSYNILELPKSGTVFLNLSESVQPVFGNKVELRTKKPAELVTDAHNSAQTKSTVFTVFWVVLVLAELGGLGYAVFRYEDY